MGCRRRLGRPMALPDVTLTFYRLTRKPSQYMSFGSGTIKNYVTCSGNGRNFHLGATVEAVWKTEVPSSVQGRLAAVGYLKQFADSVYRFWV